MLKKISLLASVAIVMSGCSDSETTVSHVSGDSTFSCAQLNESDALGNTALTGRILTSAFNQLDKAYVEDTVIQRFYRGLVRADVDYRYQFARETLQACEGNAKKGVKRAATDALNSLFARAMKEPRLATCRAYTQGTVKMDAVIREMSEPTTLVLGGDAIARGVSIVYNSRDHGASYLHNEVTSRCKDTPDQRLWSAFGIVAAPVVEQLHKEQQAAAAAERQRQEREERAARLETYSANLYSTGKATCKHFRELTLLARPGYADSYADQRIFEAALKATVADIPRPEMAHQRTAFEKALRADYQGTVDAVSARCDGEDSLETALLKTDIVTDAQTPYFTELRSLYQEKRSADWCGRVSVCEEAAEHDAARRAFQDGTACESGEVPESGLCFAVPAESYAYHLALIKLEQIGGKLRTAQSKLQEPPLDRELDYYAEPCKRRLLERGLQGEAYTAEVNRTCQPEAMRSYLEPMEAELAAVERELADRKAAVETARERGIIRSRG